MIRKVAVFRQWFACVYGYKFENHKTWKLPDTSTNIYKRYYMTLGTVEQIGQGSAYEYMKSPKIGASSIYKEVTETGTFDLGLAEFDFREQLAEFNLKIIEDTIKAEVRSIPTASFIPDSEDQSQDEPHGPVELKIVNVRDMAFRTLKRFRTGTDVDKIFSDLEPDGGIYGGSVYICTGESGVGKSTLLADLLMKIKVFEQQDLDQRISAKLAEKNVKKAAKIKRFTSYCRKKYGVNPLYISSEMTQTDLWFYYQKMPIIADLPTLLMADYIKGGLKEAITKAFESDYDIILLDSYQDMVEKMKDILNWSAKMAQNFLIQLMVEAAEKHGKCVIAIQHLTKGGEYVGSTYLKHTTTGMIDIKFDDVGQRYVMFEKNRRGGSMINKPLYFILDKQTKELRYDGAKFEEARKSAEMVNEIEDVSKRLNNKFDTLFESAKVIKDNTIVDTGSEGEHDDD
jgi:archaellum biogenesis ATPase FlaH